MRFVDTNVLVYAVSSTAREGEKVRRARELLDGRDLALSVQVLVEEMLARHRRAVGDVQYDAQLNHLFDYRFAEPL